MAITPILLSGQDYKTRYENLYSESKFEEIFQLLVDWEKAEPENPEMFIANFNYYLQKSQQEVMQMDTKPGEGQNLTIADTATGEPVGYLYSKIYYNDDLFNKAQKYLVDGLKVNPYRLDMYFGRIYSLRERGMLEDHVSEIINVIEKHKTYRDKWLWSNNEKLRDSEAMFSGSMQDYNYALFSLKPPYISGIREISAELIKLYPDDLRYYSNLGACNLMEEKWDDALKILEEAEKIDKTDYIVLGNIAYAYMMKGDKKQAISYFEKVVKFSPDQEAEFAKEQIAILKKDLKM